MNNKLNLFKYFKKYSLLYFIAFVAMAAAAILDMFFPLITKHIVDDVLIAKKINLLKTLIFTLVAIGIARCIFQYVQEYLCDIAGSRIASELRINLFQKIQSLSANFFDKTNSGELMSRVKDDVDHIWDIVTFMAILMAEVIVRIFATIYFMVKLNLTLSVIPILGMVGVAVIAIFMEKKLDELFGNLSDENSKMNNTAAENLSGVRTVKAFSREGFEIAKFHKHNQKYYEINIDLSRVFVKYNPMIQLISRFLTIVTLLIGGIFVIKGNPLAGGQKISVGELMAFLQFVGNMIWPMELLGWLTNGFSNAKASVKRLNKIYEENPEITDDSILTKIFINADEEKIEESIFLPADITGQVQFKNITYKIGKRKILDNVSFKIESGKTLGIMGATGSGKTSIINLLKRMYNATSGDIFIDDINIKDLPLSTLRKSVSCVMQDIFLFSDTIDGNIRLGFKEKMSNDDVNSSLTNSCSKEFVEKMHDKEQTVIGERGVGLSGGQKQRITIARALARKTPILVLDDSTSALDTETEQEIQNVLRDLHGMTKIIIAHRISAVKNADKIIVLENGKIAEEGTHEELLKIGGLYKETYDSQY